MHANTNAIIWQVGHVTAMSQPVGVANGVVNRGLAALGSLNDAGPGFFYYGVNGAGRGLVIFEAT